MSGRLDCLAWCEALPAGDARGALLQGTQQGPKRITGQRHVRCSCCPKEIFHSAVRSEGCDVACADQEDVIYAAPVFAQRPLALCGGAEAFSAFRQWDGLSPLGSPVHVGSSPGVEVRPQGRLRRTLRRMV